MKTYTDLKNEVVLLLSSNRGTGLPKDFIEETEGVEDWEYNVSDEDIECLKEGDTPENEWYWEAWTNVLDNATFTYPDGSKGVLHLGEACGDLFVIPEGYSFEDEEDESEM